MKLHLTRLMDEELVRLLEAMRPVDFDATFEAGRLYRRIQQEIQRRKIAHANAMKVMGQIE